ncbi:MAG TPA: ATP-dependent RecD-like DNA helicase [Bacilli bacterium]|jgi:exodeoxyribonuclease V alpha subunit|nr:ATP-dependent RecD-like DNA helicase [Acholeplasmataceae bacterium]HNZ77803.1 ATP-dependent RecD-like DNA helicase [Bacilli bacterium]HOD60928.1 ATP-dependent RecD-like DNA helicase [Bacilli bacterium]HOH61090.1 ATP-dependent RecD-like DNA helicase [Bacilli bacterium]HPB48696.1 ATP-dependent RecD-like DNA helicase [Bacilli bacterium]
MEENIYGSVSKITYFNEENGYGIIKIKLNYQDNRIAKYRAKLFSNILTVTCNFDRKPLINEEYDFNGEFVTTSYGIQFKAKGYSRRGENTLEGVITYLSSDLFPKIGKISATKIFETLGSDCLDQIEKDKNVLDKVAGLTAAQKTIIYDSLMENRNKKKLTVGLLNLGISMQMSLKLIKTLGDNVLDIIRENPYRLMDLVEGYGFIKCDKIALDYGFKKDDILRIGALIRYILRASTYSNGDTYVEYNELYNKCINEFNKEEVIITSDNFDKTLQKLITEKKIYVDGEKNIFDASVYQAEGVLAQKIVSLLQEDFDYGYDLNEIDSALAKVTNKLTIVYGEKQLQAIKCALRENIMIITGGPGTGKSTIIKGIIETYIELFGDEAMRDQIALLAPTGRAAKRLKEVTKHESAQTIHRFLGYEGHGIFRNGPENPISVKMVIIDEVSMVDVLLMSRLLASLYPETKVIMVGDVDQLPSVGPGEVLQNLIATKEITTISLDKIHRQAENSTIISFAHAINNGYLPETLLEKQHDRNFIPLDDENILENIIKVVDQALVKGMDMIHDIQVLIPLYRGELGINALNERMQEYFNPLKDKDIELKHLTRKFRINDKVIQLVNRSEKQVMNGDIGMVYSFDFEGKTIEGLSVMFDSGLVSYKKAELEDLTHAYAISIHKAQGSEFDLVVMPFTLKYYVMLKRKLIYTAVTRAKKYLIMLGNVEAINRGIQGIESHRKTKLIQKIKQIFAGVYQENIEICENLPEEEVSPYDFM